MGAVDFVPVNLAVGPDSALYIPNFWTGGIYRLRHFEGDQPPEARISADPAPYGKFDDEGVFEVTLRGSDSTDSEDDAEGLRLTYEWDLDADGSFDDDVGEAVELEFTVPDEEPIVQLRVTDSEGATDVARITLYPGDLPPEGPEMELPEPGVEWTVGEEIELSGSATDPEDADSGEPPRLDWDVFLRHCPDRCHSHPHAHLADRASASVVAPDHEYPSHLEVKLTATDSRGLAESLSREIYPKAVDVKMRSEPRPSGQPYRGRHPGGSLSAGAVAGRRARRRRPPPRAAAFSHQARRPPPAGRRTLAPLEVRPLA